MLPQDGDLDHARSITDKLLDPLRAVAEPLLDTWHPGPPSDALTTHGDPPQPVPSAGDTFCIDDFDAAAAAAWVRLVGPGSGSSILWAELRQLGGAFRETSPTGGVHNHLDADVAVYLVDVPPGLGARERADTAFSTIRAGMSPWTGPWTVPTLVEQATQPQCSFPR